MYREMHLLQASACREIQDGLGEQAVLQARRKDDGLPYSIKFRVRQGTDVMELLRNEILPTFLFISPERLQQNDIMMLLTDLSNKEPRGLISRFVIDEAQCVLQVSRLAHPFQNDPHDS